MMENMSCEYPSFQSTLRRGAKQKTSDGVYKKAWREIERDSQREKVHKQELAEKAGLHLTYVGHLELGKYHPTVFVMWKISKALGVSMNELMSF